MLFKITGMYEVESCGIARKFCRINSASHEYPSRLFDFVQACKLDVFDFESFFFKFSFS